MLFQWFVMLEMSLEPYSSDFAENSVDTDLIAHIKPQL